MQTAPSALLCLMTEVWSLKFHHIIACSKGRLPPESDYPLCFPLIGHSDIVKRTTTDPVNRPLPSYELLHMRFRISQIVSTLWDKDPLKCLFGKAPPVDDEIPDMEDADDNLDSGDSGDKHGLLSQDWKDLIELVTDKYGIYSPRGLERWRKCLAAMKRKSATDVLGSRYQCTGGK